VSDAQAQAAAELALGRELIVRIHVEPDVAACDDMQTRSMMVGGVAITALLRAAREQGLNKLSIIEGVGMALGLIQAGQAPEIAAHIAEALAGGLEVGRLEALQEKPRPVLRVIEGDRP
jgi:hypothetical protein